MKLQTSIPLSPTGRPIDYTSSLVLIGSCFSESIGNQLDYYQFQHLQNPFGILFHPRAIEEMISRAVRNKPYAPEEVFFLNGRWHCYDAHSELSHRSQKGLIDTLNVALKRTMTGLATASHILITLGTAWVYRHRAANKVVANCHKVPQKEFFKELLSVADIKSCLERMVRLVGTVNENVSITFTLSPVRHLKDGFVENQRSKAHLLTALHGFLVEETIADTCSYFPSYEIMMDELRDYRFYDVDMMHPNPQAVRYIWEKFVSVYMTPQTQTTMEKVERVQKGLAHHPFDPESDQHLAFKKSLQQKIAYLEQEYPHMKFVQ